MSTELAGVIAATAQWLVRAYPASGGVVATTLAEALARQAVTVAAWLRYPTTLDAALVELAGPGGSRRLDELTGVDPDPADASWRSWVDEVVASWAACLLADPALAIRAVAAVVAGEHAAGLRCDFRRLTRPDELDHRASPLLRHPDLLAPVADLHGRELLARLAPGTAAAA